MHELAGQSWGDYAILAELGRDDLGVTYRARDVSSSRDVRLWILHASITRNNPSLERRLRAALDKLKDIHHPNVATVLGMEWADEQLGIISEHVPGPTLRSVLSERGSLPAWRAAEIARDLALALDAVHSQGIEQIDVRPTNVVLAESGRAVLTDLGLGHLVRSLTPQSSPHSSTRLPAYVSPEVAQGESCGVCSDIYALGITLFEMLAGNPPFQGTDTEVLLAHQNIAPLPPSQLARRVPEALDAVVGKMLAKEPSMRHQSGKEAAAELARLVRARKPRVSLPSQLRVPAGLIVALVALAAVAWWAIAALGAARPAERIVAPGGNAGIMGTYEVSLPRKVRPNEAVAVRLTIHLPERVSYEDLPLMPPSNVSAKAPGALMGTLPLCQQLWASLESPGLDVLGASTLRRTVRESGAEWVWSVCCRPESVGPQSAVIRIYARSEEQGAPTEVLLKEIPFSLDASAGSGLLVSAELGIAVIGAIMVGVIILLIATWKRSQVPNADLRGG